MAECWTSLVWVQLAVGFGNHSGPQAIRLALVLSEIQPCGCSETPLRGASSLCFCASIRSAGAEAGRLAQVPIGVVIKSQMCIFRETAQSKQARELPATWAHVAEHAT